MDSSRRAVESYWRSRMIDGATSNEDKVTPVYKLEEICELLRSSDVGIVKEVSEFVLKRLDNKSPVVKQKALRLIKYCVGKSGVEFQREIQRHSVVIRQLIHYKGEVDPLKGDSLNKAVRETAQEVLSSIFAEVENKPAPTKSLDKRIEGFGNANFRLQSEEKNSFLSDVVNLGSMTIKQGLSNLAQSHSMGKNDNGSYRGPNLHRSLTVEREGNNEYEPVRFHGDAHNSSSWNSSDMPSGSSNYSFGDSRVNGVNGDCGSNLVNTREDQLLKTIVTSGGVRLQPTRDAIQVFLAEAEKLDALALSQALELKLNLPQWQIRFKALCVLESILRRMDNEPFSIISSYFSENPDILVKCSESPQASLRDKAVKVLRLLEVEQSRNEATNSEKTKKAEIQMPDLIDTGSDLLGGTDDCPGRPTDSDTRNVSANNKGALIEDLLGDRTPDENRTHLNNDDDPFSDVSFHIDKASDQIDNLFTGMSLSDKKDKVVDPFLTPTDERGASYVDDLLAGFPINGGELECKRNVGGETAFEQQPITELYPAQQAHNDALSSMLGSQMTGTGAAFGHLPLGVPPGLLFNFQPQQPLNYGPGTMNDVLVQQQYLAMMSNFQQFVNLSVQNVGVSQVASDKGSVNSPLFPDIFQTNFLAQPPTSMMSNSRKEDTKAFDFISDHLAAARDTKRLL